MNVRIVRGTVFWLVLVAFFVWDWDVSRPVDFRHEPPLIAAGSGQAPSGGHCSAF